jgi:flagellar hook-length control protein FliK
MPLADSELQQDNAPADSAEKTRRSTTDHVAAATGALTVDPVNPYVMAAQTPVAPQAIPAPTAPTTPAIDSPSVTAVGPSASRPATSPANGAAPGPALVDRQTAPPPAAAASTSGNETMVPGTAVARNTVEGTNNTAAQSPGNPRLEPRGTAGERAKETAIPSGLPLPAEPPPAMTERKADVQAQLPDFAALSQSQGLAASSAPAPSDRTEAATATLPTPVTDPAFREALGMQVSVMAQDGIQSAELQLNPSHMGPISVRIEVDGNQAQVNFGVDHAQTRAIVEAGLPELASALREAGFTLTGGGVSEHGRGQAGTGEGGRDGGRPQDPSGSRSGRGGSTADAEPTPPPRRARLAGAVDMYA